MDCFLTSGVPCVLKQSIRPDLFEVHVTIGPRCSQDVGDFVRLCREQGWKAIVIDLDPQVAQQPMTCSRIIGDLEIAHAHAEQVRHELEMAAFPVSRIKIEAAPWNRAVPQEDKARSGHHPTAYFEYHAKLHLPASGWEDQLSWITHAFGAHLSRNALKQGADGWTDRFVTIRNHRCGLRTFEQQTRQFSHMLHAHGFSVRKSVTEYCIYDSNLGLDAIWYG